MESGFGMFSYIPAYKALSTAKEKLDSRHNVHSLGWENARSACNWAKCLTEPGDH